MTLNEPCPKTACEGWVSKTHQTRRPRHRCFAASDVRTARWWLHTAAKLPSTTTATSMPRGRTRRLLALAIRGNSHRVISDDVTKESRLTPICPTLSICCRMLSRCGATAGRPSNFAGRVAPTAMASRGTNSKLNDAFSFDEDGSWDTAVVTHRSRWAQNEYRPCVVGTSWALFGAGCFSYQDPAGLADCNC